VSPAARREPPEQDGVAIPSKRRTVVMSDVARAAGVSAQTVSRVFNEPERVRPHTRARVLAVIEELGYRVNNTARALATGQRHTLGVVGFDTSLHGPASVLFGIERHARTFGYSMVVASLEERGRDSLDEAVEHLRGQDVEGIVVIAPPASASSLLQKAARDIPVVAVEGDTALGLPVVAVDQYGGAMRATRHLLDLGHATAWHLAGPRDWLGSAQTRERGWRDTLRSAGVAAPPALVGDWSARSGYELGRQLAADPAVTAVFAGNDQMALGLLKALHEAGRRVPADVSVVGFDDTPEAAYYTPALTTVRQEFTETGRRAFGLLYDQINGGGTPAEPIVMPVDLIVRDSTARASARR
jgi:DNA-binding LacI/PurR family transcriptional regulator